MVFQGHSIQAQNNIPQIDDETGLPIEDSVKRKRIEIINTDVFEFETTDSNTLRRFNGNVFFRHEGTEFQCDKALQYLEEEIMVATGNLHIQKPDSFDVWADYLVYYSKLKLAKFRGNVIFKDSTAKLMTDSLDYDLDADIGKFWGGGSFKSDTSLLTSDEGIYYHRNREAFFYGNVHLTNPDLDLYADSMRYDTRERIAYFIAPTKIIKGEDVIYCESGYFDTENNIAQFDGNTDMTSGSNKIKAQELVYDSDSGYGEARGNVIWEDTVEQITIVANYIEYNDSSDYVLATEDPLMIDITDDDTLYLSADTLITYAKPYTTEEFIYKDTIVNETEIFDTIIETNSVGLIDSIPEIDTTISIVSRIVYDTVYEIDTLVHHDTARIFSAYEKTKLLSGRLSGICDSLYYSNADSTFKMYNDPFVWVDTTQFSGDSIKMVLKNKKMHRIFIHKNAFIIHESGPNIFDQTKGKQITGYFKDDDLNKMVITGNGESIYFIQDDSSAYVGGNKTLCSKMVIHMKNDKKEVDHITFITKPEATFTPFTMINLGSYRLEDFVWNFDKKPKTVEDIVRHMPIYEYYLQYLNGDISNTSDQIHPIQAKEVEFIDPKLEPSKQK